MKIAFLINGNSRGLKQIVREIGEIFEDMDHTVLISEYGGHFNDLSKTALQSGHDHFIFIGGDGSVNEGINGIIDFYKTNQQGQPDDYDWTSIAKIKWGVFPAGTGNDYVKSVYETNNLGFLKQAITEKINTMVDVGWVRYQLMNDQPHTRFFMNITDVGMGSDVVRKKTKLPGWFSSKLSYLWAITTTLISYKNLAVRAYNDSFNWEGKIINMVIAKGKYFGNGLGIAPDAVVNNGKFSFVIIGNITMLEYFRLIGTVKKCVKVEHPNVSYHDFESIKIEPGSVREVTVEMDGEFIGKAPMELKCLGKRMCLIGGIGN